MGATSQDNLEETIVYMVYLSQMDWVIYSSILMHKQEDL